MSTFYVDSASIESLYVTDLTAITSSIQYITSSQLDVGTNIITVNTNTSPLRYGGLAVADSGSSPITSGSLLFDSLNNQWIFIHQNQISTPITSSVLIMGPQTFNDVGNEITITPNRLTKGQAGDLGEHITSSNITDTGTLISIDSNTEITGSLIITNGITEGLGVTGSFQVSSSNGTIINTTTSTLNWNNITSIDWNGRILYDQNAAGSVDWNNRQLKNTSGNTTLNWSSNVAADSAGNQTIDWENKALYDSSLNISVDWGSRLLFDGVSGLSVDWINRTLNDPVGSVILDWQNAQFNGNSLTADTSTSASFATITATSSFVTSSNVYGPHGANSVLTSSFAISASWAPNTGGGATFNGGTNVDNRLITATGITPELNGEANLTFDGSTLTVTGNVTATSFTGSLQGTASYADFAPENPATSGVGTTPTATQTDTITHDLGRTPIKIRIYGASQFTNNASATPTPFSIGTWTSSGNRCIYQPIGATITGGVSAATSTTFAIRVDSAAGAFLTGVIQNVTSTTFDIAWTETGNTAAEVYLWEAE